MKKTTERIHVLARFHKSGLDNDLFMSTLKDGLIEKLVKETNAPLKLIKSAVRFSIIDVPLNETDIMMGTYAFYHEYKEIMASLPILEWEVQSLNS